MSLDPSNVPPGLFHLVRLAEKWGIGDDYDRERAVTEAAEEELQELIHTIQILPDESLFDWLAGPESYASPPTEEYLAFTCMTMAYDSARTKLHKKRQETEQFAPENLP
jgi:hypothetical protein